MILKISDLEENFYSKEFHISVDSLPIRDTTYTENVITCIFTSEKEGNGFRLHGEISAKVEIECVRCLSKLVFASPIPVEIMVDRKYIYDKEDKRELIKIKNNYIDIGNYLADTIALSKPDYPICSNVCKGLCYDCGINKNDQSCACKIDKKSNVWDDIKSII